MKVLSYNIHKGFTLNNRRFVLDQIRQGIRQTHADVVFLQEVQGTHVRHARQVENYPSVSQFEYLAEEMWPHFAYGKNAVYEAGHHGNAILSKYPIEAWHNLDISTNAWERRGLLESRIRLPDGRPLHLFSLHLNLLGGGRRVQVDRICNHIERYAPNDEPLLLAGDFNDWRKEISAPLRERLELREAFFDLNGRYAVSYPGRWPLLSLDRVYYRNLDPVRAEVLRGDPWRRLSDHLALTVEFKG
ncbi:MAG TPA: endonuclease/exonuclease/phosphatase family protein [Bdellovibrionota bacterium]|jgi:endonuclease/exonuclease/phosphatase family metal-dependent hydrolase|nr:endonuclease/exonuclease/phosphatase family protein [Bdellovibrionota bacterium]